MVIKAQPVYRYRLNEADFIDWVDHMWLAFASENKAPELNEGSVLGHAVWEFIADKPTRNLYRAIHDHVRASGHSVAVPFRCDSPTLQRHMQLTINKSTRGKLLYESELIRVTHQPRLSMLDPKQKRSASFLTMCSFCKRSLIEPAGWLEMENIALKLRLYEKQTVPELRYTVCPECANRTPISQPTLRQAID